MASLTLKLSDDTLLRLAEAARGAGVTPDRMAEMTLEAWALNHEGPPSSYRETGGLAEPGRAWADARENDRESVQQTTPEDYEGPFVDLDDALDGFSSELHRRLKR
ncbi:MAG: hypothetical protein KKF88_00600 [Alphaproteobacteria bacterium]|nr:hypothetical protein [Alphaproteobacteria bacterium]MBU2209932.1 hypothetical protein [Alphaproteobacteria bacterium]